MTTPNNAYWLRRHGQDYAAQQAFRRRRAVLHSEYRCQERWLASFLRILRSRADRPLKILDFGCGFGRFRFLAKSAATDYRAYDFSEAMTEPLRDGEGRLPEDVRVAAHLDDAWRDDEFDLIFTVSVLIHNPTEQARELLAAMRRHLAPGGRIVLIENKLSTVSRKSNLWHAGCWIHDVAKDLAPDMSLVIRDSVLDGQSIYILQEPSGELLPAWYVGIGWRGPLNDFQSNQNSETILIASGDSVSQSLSSDDLIGRMHDLEETVSELKSVAAKLAKVDANSLGELEALHILTKAVENR